MEEKNLKALLEEIELKIERINEKLKKKGEKETAYLFTAKLIKEEDIITLLKENEYLNINSLTIIINMAERIADLLSEGEYLKIDTEERRKLILSLIDDYLI